jgi:hypothetical protein
MEHDKLICCANNYGRHMTYAEAQTMEITELKFLADMTPKEIEELIVARLRRNPGATCQIGASTLNYRQMLQVILSGSQHARTVIVSERLQIAQAQEQLTRERTMARTYIPVLRSSLPSTASVTQNDQTFALQPQGSEIRQIA